MEALNEDPGVAMGSRRVRRADVEAERTGLGERRLCCVRFAGGGNSGFGAVEDWPKENGAFCGA